MPLRYSYIRKISGSFFSNILKQIHFLSTLQTCDALKKNIIKSKISYFLLFFLLVLNCLLLTFDTEFYTNPSVKGFIIDQNK